MKNKLSILKLALDSLYEKSNNQNTNSMLGILQNDKLDKSFENCLQELPDEYKGNDLARCIICQADFQELDLLKHSPKQIRQKLIAFIKFKIDEYESVNIASWQTDSIDEKLKEHLILEGMFLKSININNNNCWIDTNIINGRLSSIDITTSEDEFLKNIFHCVLGELHIDVINVNL